MQNRFDERLTEILIVPVIFAEILAFVDHSRTNVVDPKAIAVPAEGEARRTRTGVRLRSKARGRVLNPVVRSLSVDRARRVCRPLTRFFSFLCPLPYVERRKLSRVKVRGT